MIESGRDAKPTPRLRPYIYIYIYRYVACLGSSERRVRASDSPINYILYIRVELAAGVAGRGRGRGEWRGARAWLEEHSGHGGLMGTVGWLPCRPAGYVAFEKDCPAGGRSGSPGRLQSSGDVGSVLASH